MGVEDLEVFRRSHRLTLRLYELTDSFPHEERFGLTSQIRRAAGSICANLMEGAHRSNTKEYSQFAGISRGSVGELKYHWLLAKDLGYIEMSTYEELSRELDEISRMLYGLIRTLRNSPPSN